MSLRAGLLAAGPLVVLQAALLLVWDLARDLRWTLCLWALSGFALVWAVRALRRTSPAGELNWTILVAVAVLLRLLVLPLPPALSDDVYRYVWDGRVALAGENPYQHAPDDPRLTALRDDLWHRLPHRQVPTVYPPLAVGWFSIAALAPWPVLALKALLAAMDVVTCWLLWALARQLGRPTVLAAWYAWNPLVVIEVAGMGHVDALGVAGAVAAVYFVVRGRAAATGVAAALGVLGKLVPVISLPLLAHASPRPWRTLLAAGLVVGLALLPVAVAAGGVPPGLVTYGKSWEFNGPLYEPLWRAIAALGLDAAVKSGLDQLKGLTGAHEFWNRFYPQAYPQLLAKLLLLPLVAWAVWRSLGVRGGPVAASGRLFATALLASATFYPWYALWILPWAALCEQRAWLWIAASLPLAYLPQFAGVPLFPWVFLAIWAPAALLALGRPSWRRWSLG